MKDMYEHLNADTTVDIKLTIPQIAEMVDNSNYGLHRFLSAIVDIRRRSEYRSEKLMADALEEILNRGLY